MGRIRAIVQLLFLTVAVVRQRIMRCVRKVFSLKRSHSAEFCFQSVSYSRSFLMGVATLWVVFIHSQNLSLEFLRFWPLIAVLTFIKEHGTAGVDIFFLLSGLGLYYSMSKNSKLSAFYRKRFIKVFPAVFIVAAVNSALAYDPVGLPQYLCRIFLLEFFVNGSRTFWYFSFILLLYLVYPLLHRWIHSRTSLKLSVLLFISIFMNVALMIFAKDKYKEIEIAVSRIPVFIVGVWLGFCSKNDRKTRLLPTLCIAICAFAAAVLILLHTDVKLVIRLSTSIYSLSIVIIGSWVLYVYRLSNLKKLLAGFGSYSMEIYLLYERVTSLFQNVIHTDKYQIAFYLSSFVITMLGAVLLKACVEKLLAVFRFQKAASPFQASIPPKSE